MQAYAKPKQQERGSNHKDSSPHAASVPHVSAVGALASIAQLQNRLNSSTAAVQLRKFQQMADRSPHAREVAQWQRRMSGEDHMQENAGGFMSGGERQRVFQRQVDLDDFNKKLEAKDASLSNETLGRLKEIQALLADPGAVFSALGVLDEQTKAYIEQGLTATQALNLALQDTENKWMNPGRIKITKEGAIVRQEPKTKGQLIEKNLSRAPKLAAEAGKSPQARPLPPGEFVQGALTPLSGLKDVGAGAQHGEYAHRLQWYIIQHHLRKKFNEGRSERDEQEELRHLYLIMSNPARVIPHPLGLEKTDISLWDAVLDARGSWTAGKHPGAGEATQKNLKQIYGLVGYASAPLLTAVLTNRKKAKILPDYDEYLKGSDWSGTLPAISEAVTNRKLKRLTAV